MKRKWNHIDYFSASGYALCFALGAWGVLTIVEVLTKIF